MNTWKSYGYHFRVFKEYVIYASVVYISCVDYKAEGQTNEIQLILARNTCVIFLR